MTTFRRLSLVLATLLVAAGPGRADEPAQAAAPKSYQRVTQVSDTASRLDIALRRFEAADGKGPAIWLAAVTHVGDAAYFKQLQQFLNAQALVLYEGVGAPAFVDSTPADDATRADRTRDAVAFTAGVLADYHANKAAYPESLDALRAYTVEAHPRAARWLGRAVVDGWGNGLEYTHNADGFTLLSRGSDGKPGGEGAAADITADDVKAIDLAGNEQPGLQTSLATALGLVFQLDAINYDQPNFRPCDMTIRQLRQAMGGGGDGNAPREDQADGGGIVVEPNNAGAEDDGGRQLRQLLKTLDGGSMASRMLGVASRLLAANPKLQSLAKLMLIDMLGSLEGDIASNAALPKSMQQLMKTLVHDRNEIVMQGLKSAAAGPDAPKSIAVFYGAGHMIDLESRLVSEMGYKPVEDKWLSAFSADAADTGMDPRQVEAVRNLIRQQMRLMSR